MVLCLVGIIVALEVGGVVPVRRRDRVINAGSPCPTGPYSPFLPIDGVFQRLPHVVVVEGRRVGEHRQGEMLRTRHFLDGDPVAVLLQSGRVLRSTRPIASTSPAMRAFMRATTSAMPRILTSSKRARPPSSNRLALEHHADARIMRHEQIAARADRPVPVDLATRRWADHEMIVGAHVGKIGVPLRQREDDGLLAVGADVRDLITIPLAADLLSGLRRWLNEATTSPESSVLPLWNVTPWRSLKTQLLASAEGSIVSASSAA